MTGSEHDGEALSAIRAAHKLLQGQGLTIKEVFEGRQLSPRLDSAPALALLMKQLLAERAKVARLNKSLRRQEAPLS